MTNFIYSVVVETDPDDLAHEVLIPGEDTVNPGDFSYHLADENSDFTKAVSFQYPIFQLGEIMILDPEIGREVNGHYRKPSKWRVECEEFDMIEAAIERAKTLSQ